MTLHIAIPTFWVAWLVFGAYLSRDSLQISDEGSRVGRAVYGVYFALVGPAHWFADWLDVVTLWVAERTLLRAQP